MAGQQTQKIPMKTILTDTGVSEPVPSRGTAHIDDIVAGKDRTSPGSSNARSAIPNREAGEKVSELGGRRVGDIGVVRGQRVRITAIYKNGKFDYEFLASTR